MILVEWYRKSAVKYYLNKNKIEPDDTIMVFFSFVLGVIWGAIIYFIPAVSLCLFIVISLNLSVDLSLLIGVLWVLGMPCYVHIMFKAYGNYFEDTKELRKCPEIGKNCRRSSA